MNREAHSLLVQRLVETFHHNTLYTPATLREPLPKPDVPQPGELHDPAALPFIALPRLPERQDLGMSVQDAIVKRRSVRAYSSRPMPQDLLGRFLAVCAQVELFPDHDVFCGEEHRPILQWLHFYAFLWGVEGLQQGTYRYDPRRHGLILLDSEPTRDSAHRSIFQKEFCTGTGILLLAGDLTSVLMAYGQRGYRYLLMQAGLIGETAYLAGTALGIGVCANGGLRELTAQRHARLDGLHRDVIWTLAFGLIPDRDETGPADHIVREEQYA
ncbi:MAG: hypothetical protein KatS3mg057_2598 [Herpetosiphonaceae bacterium]|nr:MAG: hypothetical protein KatS3mg057_2598 [Herpetosiphonaceae bacterium]